jgi:hypothetical protein
MFNIPLDQRFEVMHGDDGTGRANTCRDASLGQTSSSAAGRAARSLSRLPLRDAGGDVGLGALPEEAFGQPRYCTDWLDTEYSQRMLRYQRHSADEIIRILPRSGWKRYLAGLSRLHRASEHPEDVAVLEKVGESTQAAGFKRTRLFFSSST